jgi:holo-[acyl-carrier protein] synthase
MTFGIGIDTIEVPRIANSIATYGDQFVMRIFSPEEIRYSAPRPHAAEHFAARFAAKEAFAKALGTGVRRGFIWKEVSVRKAFTGQPFIELGETMRARAQRIVGVNFRIKVSITHTKEIAEAIVLIELVEPQAE